MGTNPGVLASCLEAQRDGVIVVEGLYLVGNELRVYFRFASDSTTYFALSDILRANAREFAIQHPGRVTYNFGDHRCSGGDGEASFRDCMLDYTFTSGGPIFPWDRSLRCHNVEHRRCGRPETGRWLGVVAPAMACGFPGCHRNVRYLRRLRCRHNQLPGNRMCSPQSDPILCSVHRSSRLGYCRDSRRMRSEDIRTGEGYQGRGGCCGSRA